MYKQKLPKCLSEIVESYILHVVMVCVDKKIYLTKKNSQKFINKWFKSIKEIDVKNGVLEIIGNIHKNPELLTK